MLKYFVFKKNIIIFVIKNKKYIFFMEKILNKLKEELLYNATDYQLWSIFNNENKIGKYLSESNGKIKKINFSYEESIIKLINEIKNNINDYIVFNKKINSFDDLNWDKIEIFYQTII